MKTSIVGIALFLTFNLYCLWSNQMTVNSELITSKVFLKGAELTHNAESNIKKGINEIVLENLADQIDENSIKVSAKGDAVILSVVRKFDYLQEKKAPAEIKKLTDSLKAIDYKRKTFQNQINAINSQLDLMEKNKLFGSKDKGITIAELKQMAEFYHDQTLNLQNDLLKIYKSLEILQQEEDNIRNQLNQLNSSTEKPVSQVVVTVSANSDTKLILTLSYLTYEAGWTPFYDIRVEDVDKDIKLNYKADVWQNSGIDWKDIKIILTTRDPTISGNKPVLSTLYIDFLYSNYADDSPLSPESSGGWDLFGSRNSYVGSQNRSSTMIEEKYEKEAIEELEDSKTSADITGLSKKLLSVEFSPSIKYSIPSDGKNQVLALHDYDIKGEYEYYTAPKINGYAYLISKIKDWEKYNLLPARANVYFEGSFVGKSYVNPKVSDNELVLSLGRDESIVVTRDIMKDFTEDKFLSSDIERHFGYKNIIKNNKDKKIKIIIEEQIPVTKNEDIVVKLIEQSNAVFDEFTGKLKWVFEIEAGQTKEIKFVFSVKHPSDKKVTSYN